MTDDYNSENFRTVEDEPHHGEGEAKASKARGNGANGNGKVDDWPFLTFGETTAADLVARPYLIKGLVDCGAFSVWYGPPKGGKSFVLLDLALHIAAGRSWRGHRTKQGRVLYLSIEGGNGIRNRLIAAQQKFGAELLPFHALPVPLDLLNGDADNLLEFIKAKTKSLGQFDLIVLDTLSRAMPGADENSPTAMTALVHALDRMRAETKAHLAAVHHCGLSRSGPRGHSSLPAAYDLGVEIERGAIRVRECREGPEGAVWRFKLDAVELGEDSDGDQITSCIVRELGDKAAGEPEQSTQRRALRSNEKVALDCVNAAIVDHGKPAAEVGAVARDISAHATVVRRSRVDETADRYMTQTAGNKRREALARALISLQAKHLLKHVDGWIWIPSHVA